MLVGIKAGSALDAIRRRRPEARNQAQASYRALFAPEMPGEVTATERFAVAAFVTGLHASGLASLDQVLFRIGREAALRLAVNDLRIKRLPAFEHAVRLRDPQFSRRALDFDADESAAHRRVSGADSATAPMTAGA